MRKRERSERLEIGGKGRLREGGEEARASGGTGLVQRRGGRGGGAGGAIVGFAAETRRRSWWLAVIGWRRKSRELVGAVGGDFGSGGSRGRHERGGWLAAARWELVDWTGRG